MAVHDGRTIVIPLPWSTHFSPRVQTHWTQRAQADRAARKAAFLALQRVAPTLTVPPGHVCDVEYVFIPPNGRAVAKERLAQHMEALRLGLADFLGCNVWHFEQRHRVAKVPTPGGEVLVKLRICPVKGMAGDS